MPLISSTSSISRMAEVIEILDISNNDALTYLTAMGVSKTLAQRSINLTGGRFIHLIKQLRYLPIII